MLHDGTITAATIALVAALLFALQQIIKASTSYVVALVESKTSALSTEVASNKDRLDRQHDAITYLSNGGGDAKIEKQVLSMVGQNKIAAGTALVAPARPVGSATRSTDTVTPTDPVTTVMDAGNGDITAVTGG